MGALAHVTEVDGRRIADGEKGPVTRRVQQAYEDHILETATPLPF